MKPVIDEELCLRQKRACEAMPACPRKAIYHIPDETSPTGVRIVIDYDRCDCCGICVDACCGSAIYLE